jgi:protein MpaA
LHADDTSDGLYGYAHGRTLNEQLLMPALRESSFIIPCNRERMIDGFAANDGMICDCFKGILAPPPTQHPRPFEIIFETPALAPLATQAEATCYALVAMLREYRGFVAQGGDL